jgi:peptidoglycan-associated lipoprotein
MRAGSTISRLTALLLVAFAVAGCAGTGGAAGGDGMAPGGSDVMAGGDSGTAGGTGLGTAPGPSGEVLGGTGGAGSAEGGTLSGAPRETIIYFDFDRSAIPEEYRELLAEHASFIRASGLLDVRIEGHADERGSREYNIGLGERRAQAVRQALTLQGVPVTRLSTVSYGEERPVAFGHDERSWALNRRVEIVYGQR